MTDETPRHPRWTAEGAPMDRVPAAHVPHSEYDPDEPQPMELTVAPTREDSHRWTVTEALAVLKAAEEAEE